ncbi:hypothetical protein [Roseimicrobium sp. ORNL1]|uniref:hypothetical protein n=1 Tax=Roseimicrobium sp. ORNL1 TaxID=2711231 RepID=UPI0013E0FDE2|nr:hypothetical protein [Roseimicrobium sp. ORNL1]QIF00970.1 hypothetical protein G5S37_05375 [Roseimicrobium sp. ORNL1]
METSNQTEGTPTPYGEPPQQDYETGQDALPDDASSWGWQPKPPVTRATTPVENTDADETPYLAPSQPTPAASIPSTSATVPVPLPFPASQPTSSQQFYSPKVQPILRPQPAPAPTATQPLDPAPLYQPVVQTPAPAPAPRPAPAPAPAPTTATAPVSASVAADAPPAVGGTSRRRPILGEESEKAEQLGLTGRAATSYMVSGVRHANKRRNDSLLKLLGLLFLVNLLVIGGFGAWLYNYFVTQVEGRMADFANRPATGGANGSGSASARATFPANAGGATAVEIKQLQDNFEKRFADLKSQLQVAQSRLTEYESTQQQQQTRVNALSSQMASSPGNDASKGTPTEPGAAAVVPGVEFEIPPSSNDLILLKERNRLTSYADEAIATGARVPYDRLWEALEDPRFIKLIHAARAEILRVQNFYLSGSRIESYTIQVGDYFPENASLKDSQLRDEQLIELLEKKENPWQVRMKAANLLGLRRSRAVGDALVRAVKYDPNLDVVKEATFSFEQMSGYRARIFEPASMDAWWTQYNSSPASNSNANGAAPKDATATASTNGPAPKKTAKSSAPAPTPPPAAEPPPAAPVKEMQPELRLPEWDEAQEARDRADKAVSDQQKAREKKDAEKQATAPAAEPAKKKKKSE